LLARQLSHHAFHLQVEKRSQNLRSVQAGVFHEFVNMPGFFSGEQLVEPFFRCAQRCGGEKVTLFRFGTFGLTSAARTGVGSSSITSSAFTTNFAPCLIRRLGA
jgi:hypothetical protein